MKHLKNFERFQYDMTIENRNEFVNSLLEEVDKTNGWFSNIYLKFIKFCGIKIRFKEKETGNN